MILLFGILGLLPFKYAPHLGQTLYPDSNFNVVILNLVGGEYQFANSRENTGYLAVASGNRVFTIFKYIITK